MLQVYQDMYEQSMQQYELEMQEYAMGQYGEAPDPRRPTSPLADAAMTALELASRYGATLNVKQEVEDWTFSPSILHMKHWVTD